MYTLSLEHHFSAAHQLTHAYDNKCNDSIHGHNWRVLVEIKTGTLHNGMVIDFTKLKEIIDELDHKNLNMILDFEPTAENLVRHLWARVTEEMKEQAAVTVTLWEADKASISYDGVI